jgi:nucleoside-diphosphate-sugar epimerase
MSKVYVIGPNGYIGSNLIKELIRQEREVVTIGRDDDFTILSKTSDKDVVINCAGTGMKPMKPSPEAYLAENVLLPVKIAKFTAWSGVKMIHLASYFEFFMHDIYAKSKSLASEMLKTKPTVTIAYLYNVYGRAEYPNRFYAGLKSSIINNTAFTLTTPGACRSLIHIDHVTAALNEIIDKPVATYHLTDGFYTTMSAIVHDVKAIFPQFKCDVKDAGPKTAYSIECYRPSAPYFKRIDLMGDIKADIKVEGLRV